MRLPGALVTIGCPAFVDGRAGRLDDALNWLTQWRTAAATAHVAPPTLAFGRVGLEDWDAAFRWSDQAVEVRDPLVVPIKPLRIFDPVRGDSRYRALLRRMNLSED